MKIAIAVLSTAAVSSIADTVTPIGKILQILGDCESKIIREGEEAQKVFDEYSEWCEDRHRELEYEVKTAKADSDELQATIKKAASNIDVLTTQIEELAAEITSDEKDLAAATKVREAEAADFAAASKELTEVIDALDRAIGLIEREMAKGGASMMQLKSASNLADAFKALVAASVFSSADASRLTALVQSSQGSDDDDSDSGAPDAAVYESHSGGIVDTLQGLLEKAEGQLADAQKKETTARNNFEMLKQSLQDEIKYANKEKSDATKGLGASQEYKATAEGDLAVTQKDLAEDEETLSEMHHDCLTRSQDFEAETKSRGEELAAIAAAKKAVKEAVSSAASFLQIDSRVEPSSLVVHFVRDLARKQNSQALAQLASRISTAVRLSSGIGEDPFAKVKGLITDMIAKLEEDSKADADHKAYCDKEMAESKQKKIEKTAEVDHLSTKIEQMSSASAKLKEEVATLQKELAELASTTAEMDSLRQKEKAIFKKNKAESETGLEGVKLALKVLREYYAKSDSASHSTADGTSSGVIGLLEVVESDFTKGLAEMIAVENTAEAEYVMETKKNEVVKAMKEQDVKYKTKEYTGLDKSVAEHKSDRDGAQEELDAVLDYLNRLDDMCVAKPESYAERAARREAEIAGLKNALSILDSETAFLQKKSTLKSLRGVRSHSKN